MAPAQAWTGGEALSRGGLSTARLARLHGVMAGYVERGEVPGLVTLVSRHGDVQVDAIGKMAVGGEPVRRDTIFRIASLTKPVAAAAAMILVEECKVRLDEPVDRLLPELANRKVLKRLDGPLDDTIPAKRPITLRDLLTLRMGLGYVMAPPSSAGPVGKFGWDGGLGTSWYSDPREDMVTLLMTQRAWTSPDPPKVCRDFWTSAYQAIDD
jgi:CubicO group peptidase (beta-lactamase class C family)